MSKADDVARAEARRRELNDAAIAKLMAERGQQWTRGDAPRATPTGPVCPHCGVRGQVATQSIRVKRGLSGAKSTAALLTQGLSILVTGLSRKETVTAARCGACGIEWTIA